MGIKTVPQLPYTPDLAPCDFWLFPKLSGCHYETIEEMKEAVTKVIDILTQEDFYEAFQKLLERYNKCRAAGGDYFEEEHSFMCVLSIKVPIRKKSGNLSYTPHIYVCMSTLLWTPWVKLWSVSIFEIHLSWVFSNYCSNCSFKPEIIRIGQSSHKMYNNNILNFQESMTILNADTKKVWNLIVCTSYIYIYIYIYIYMYVCMYVCLLYFILF